MEKATSRDDSDDSTKKLLNETEDFDEPDEKTNRTTFLQTLMHFIKVSVGIGMFGLPVAVKNAGIVVGPIAMVVVAIVVTHCMLLLVKSAIQLGRLSGRTSLDYGETAEECVRIINEKYAKAGSYTVNVGVCLSQIGICTVYLLFVARNMEQVLTELHVVDLGVLSWILILFPFLIALAMIRKLSSLALVSTIANLFMAFAIVSIFVYLVPNAGSPSKLKAFAGWSDFPLFMGVFVFTLDVINVVLPLQNDMKEPKHITLVLKIGMTVALIIAVAIGFLGYLTCQHECKGSVTLNLPATPFYSTVKLMVVFSVFSSYFVQAYVLFKMAESWITDHLPTWTHFLTDTLMRVLIVIFTWYGIPMRKKHFGKLYEERSKILNIDIEKYPSVKPSVN